MEQRKSYRLMKNSIFIRYSWQYIIDVSAVSLFSRFFFSFSREVFDLQKKTETFFYYISTQKIDNVQHNCTAQ